MKTKIYGYLRVSSKDQNADRQLDAIKPYQIPKRQTYIDKQSGKDFIRPEYIKLMKKLKPGDLLILKSIDRLGRNYVEIIEQWRIITKEKGADIKQRQAEGIAAAKARGISWGKKPLPRPPELQEYTELWRQKKIRLEEVAEKLGVSRSTAYAFMKEKK